MGLSKLLVYKKKIEFLLILINVIQVCEELKTEREQMKAKLGLTQPINPTG